MPAKPPPANPRAPKYRIGQNIRDARELLGITQLALAHSMGYKGPDAGSYISSIESGRRELRIATLEKFSKALGVSLEALLAK